MAEYRWAKDHDWTDLEPERYEFYAGPAYDFALSRRELWKILGAGFLVVFTDCAPGAAKGELLSTRLHIGENGVVTVMTGKVEVGQGSRTELTQVVAEELAVDPGRVRIVMGDTRLCPDDGGTWGSLTTPQTVPVVRRAAAAARRLLAEVQPGEKLPGAVPDEVEVTDPSDWRVCGRPHPAVDGRDIVTGRHKYSPDLRASGALFGKVKRPPAHTARLVRVDAAEAKKLAGVRIVRDGDFLGVTAPTRSLAEEAVERIEAEWQPEPLVPAAELAAHFKKTAKEPVFRQGARYPALLRRGSLEDGFAAAAETVEAAYFVHYIAHVPMEPRAALATWEDGRLTVETGTQVPFGVRRELCQAFGLSDDQVRVQVPDTGGGFGGKHRGECALEAARLARDAGRPVLLEWSREEEFTRSYARPAGLIEVRSGMDADGKVTAWDFHNYNSGAAGLTPPYRFPNHYCGFHRAESPLRQGSYRSLAAAANNFAREMQMEELAARLDVDPVEFRLRNVSNGRLRTVIERVAAKFGWRNAAGGDGRGFGFACTIEKGGHVALAIELETDGKSAKLTRAVVAMDCGAVINPDNLHNQVTGAVIQGIGGALWERLRYDGEKIANPRLSAYRVPRFTDIPEIEVLLVDRRDQPSAGAGESPITVVAPAIGAALHNATGRWFRTLPMLP